MTAPRTRIDAGATDFERELLGSWEHEGPSRRARERALGIIGAGAGLGATATTGAAGAVGSAIARVAAPKAMASSALAVAKWFAVGSVVVAGAVSVAPFVSSRSSKEAAPPALTSKPIAETSVTANRGALSPGVIGRTSRISEDEREVPPPTAPGAITPPNAAEHLDAPARKIEPASTRLHAASAVPASELVGSSTTEAPSIVGIAGVAAFPVVSDVAAPPESAEKHGTRALGDQVASVDRARTLLGTGDVAAAIRELDVYDSRFPRGALAQEAIVLRVEGLVKQGSRTAARALGDRFLSLHPTSPHATKIRQLLGIEKNR